jgi:hypothetical protein
MALGITIIDKINEKIPVKSNKLDKLIKVIRRERKKRSNS